MGKLNHFACMVYEDYCEKILNLRSRCTFVDNADESVSPYAMYDKVVRIVLGCLLRPDNEPFLVIIKTYHSGAL